MASPPHRTLFLGLCSQVLSQGPLPVAHSTGSRILSKHLSPLLPEADLMGVQGVWNGRRGK